MLRRIVFVALLASLLAALTPAAAQDAPPVLPLDLVNDLPAVTPLPNPAALTTAFGPWDWAAFMADFWEEAPPDPLAVALPPTYQGDLPAAPFNLADVRFADEVAFTPAQQALLAQNGFVVVPGGLMRFEEAYQWDETWETETGHSYWVTTDALLHTLHIVFDNLLAFVEREELVRRVSNVTFAAQGAAAGQFAAAEAAGLGEAAQAAQVYYAVALGLLDTEAYGDSVPVDVKAIADPIIGAALAAEGRLDVPFLPDYEEDFSQYQPRGRYAGNPAHEAYFRAMMWLGRITFLARDDASLRAGLLALRALVNSDAYADWQMVSDTLGFLIGPGDNLGPTELLPLARDIFGADLALDAIADDALLAQFRDAVMALPGPRIANVIRPMETQADELDDATRGFRVFGQRFTFDGYAMQQLIYPEVGAAGSERILPSALDIAAVFGSDTAYDLLRQRGDTAYENYDTNLAALRQEVGAVSAEDWLQTTYGGWMLALQPLWNRDADVYPPLLNTDAWRLRDLHAGLASWTELKHDTLLYTAQPMGGLGGGGEYIMTTHSLVEPNPLVFARVAVVATLTRQAMEAGQMGMITADPNTPSGVGMLQSALKSLAYLSARLTEMARKELWGEPLSDDEQLFLKYQLGSSLMGIRYTAEFSLEDPPELAALVADIASNPDAGLVLQVGTGYVDYIYVITDSPDGLQLTRGAVYSFYEFTQPIDNRLTDQAWWDMLAGGKTPPRPAWVGPFYAE
jgi:hypothetical protein